MYVTPAFKPLSLAAQAASCCTITFYSAELGLYITWQNRGCGTLASQFPTCGPIDSPAARELPRDAQPAVDASLAVVNTVSAVGTKLLPVDVCVVSVSGGSVGMATAMTISGT